MPVRAEIRRRIKKEAGDFVNIVLYPEQEEPPIAIPGDFIVCLEDDPVAHARFRKFPAKEQQEIIDWIFSVQTDEKRVARIAQAIDLLAKGVKPS